MIVRRYYMSQLNIYRDKPFIKVMTGLRRVGKSVILDQYIDALVISGVKSDEILKLNFELPENFNISDYKELSDFVLRWASGRTCKLYLFLDEIGRVDGWEKAVNGFHAMGCFDLYITGSNADLLSSDLSTYLAGRFVEILVHPFSYSEFREAYPGSSFEDYLRFGGMPSIVPFKLHYESSMNVLRDIFQSAVLQDVISRNAIRNPVILEKLIHYIFANTGKTFSALSIANYFKSQRIKVSVDTILSYLQLLGSAFLVYRSPRNDVLGKQILKTEEKYYIADHGLREAIVGKNTASIEILLENIIFIELKRRGYYVTTAKINQNEVDFVAEKNNRRDYFQVCYLLASQATIDREFEVYRKISDNYPKYVLSMDTHDFSRDGIIHKNISDFLLHENEGLDF